MFVEAYEIAAKFTTPIVVSRRNALGDVATGIGACVLLNADGWALTAGHVLAPLVKFTQDAPALTDYDAGVEMIRASADNPGKKKQRRLQLDRKHDPRTLLRNISPWLGRDDWVVGEVRVHPDVDLGLFRVLDRGTSAPPDPLPADDYPELRSPDDNGLGTSLLKVGFPFHSIEATFDESQDMFRFAAGALPIPRFPMEGIAARWLKFPDSPGGYRWQVLQTSTPGLRGQSGGPLVDRAGVVWGIQVSTVHLPLGFSPPAGDGPKKTIEHQFLNVGQAVSTHTIKDILDQHQVAARWS